MDIFKKVKIFFNEMGLQWKDCVGVCTDGAAAMTGHTAGFQGREKSASDARTYNFYTLCDSSRGSSSVVLNRGYTYPLGVPNTETGGTKHQHF